MDKAIDKVQRALTDYACGLNYGDIPAEVIHAAKIRVIYSLGALIAGFFGDPCRIVRDLAAQMPDPNGATVIGTRMKATADMAALVNGATARYAELTDIYHWPGSYEGHPTDVVTPVLAAAEHAQAGGRDFITAIVLGYEVFLRISDVVHCEDFDNTNFCCLATAVAAAKLMGLSADRLAHAISMAIVPNNTLRQARLGNISMFKAAVSGLAGRAGVFAAMLARAGMEGPHLPFEGKAGWCDHIARGRFSLDTWGGNGTRFKILDTRLKPLPCSSGTIPAILAAENLSPINVKDVTKITVETYRSARKNHGSRGAHWNPESREVADHSIPYAVAATLMDGTVTLNSFNDAHLWNPQLRALIQKIEVVENPEFTQANERLPVEHHTRVTVVTAGGERRVGKAGGDDKDLSAESSDAQITEQFRGLTEDFLGAKRVNTILDRLWHLEDIKEVAEIPPAFVLG